MELISLLISFYFIFSFFALVYFVYEKTRKYMKHNLKSDINFISEEWNNRKFLNKSIILFLSPLLFYVIIWMLIISMNLGDSLYNIIFKNVNFSFIELFKNNLITPYINLYILYSFIICMISFISLEILSKGYKWLKK